jgi:hypothetical protein
MHLLPHAPTQAPNNLVVIIHSSQYLELRIISSLNSELSVSDLISRLFRTYGYLLASTWFRFETVGEHEFPTILHLQFGVDRAVCL